MIIAYAWLGSLAGMASLLGFAKVSAVKSAFLKRKVCHFGPPPRSRSEGFVCALAFWMQLVPPGGCDRCSTVCCDVDSAGTFCALDTEHAPFTNTISCNKVQTTAYASFTRLCIAGCGTVMILCWPLFPVRSLVNLAAASIPFLGTAQFVLVGSGILKDPAFLKGIGHEPGQERLLLRGPVQYGVCATVLTMAAFRRPLSVIPICILCAGDAAAAVWGYHKGRNKLQWNKGKV